MGAVIYISSFYSHCKHGNLCLPFYRWRTRRPRKLNELDDYIGSEGEMLSLVIYMGLFNVIFNLVFCVFMPLTGLNLCEYYGCVGNGSFCEDGLQCTCKPGLERLNPQVPFCVGEGNSCCQTSFPLSLHPLVFSKDRHGCFEFPCVF